MTDMPQFPPVESSLLLTDLYELAMFQTYLEHGLDDVASFELFVRKLPAGRGFLMAAGLAQVVEFLETARFTDAEVAWLQATGRVSGEAARALREFSFSGDVDAMPEGTVFFADEPILRVTAPLPMAQLLETRLINLMHFQTVIASKAARMVLVAGGRRLVDFGLRRAHGAEAGLLAARASYLAGFAGTATVLAGMRFDIPLSGTMAHSFIQAHDDERLAFEHFARSRPSNPVLLLDTYDTEAAARKVVALAPELARAGIVISGVRLDSGDLDALSRSVRAILDEGGLQEVQILASGGLDEVAIARLVGAGAPIEGFGVGTSLTTSSDAPALDCAYKLVEYAGLPRRKRSTGKATWPGRKQVVRTYGPDGRIAADLLTVEGATEPGRRLLVPVMRAGRRIAPLPTLGESRDHAAAELASLPPGVTDLAAPDTVGVQIAPSVHRLVEQADRATGVR